MKSTNYSVIVKSILRNEMTLTETSDPLTDLPINLTATDGNGLTITIALESTGNNGLRLSISDENNEDNFAIMYPTKGNMRSLARCMTMCMTEIVENA